MSADQIIASVRNDALRKRLEIEHKKNQADTKTLINAVQIWETRAIFARLFLSIITLGIVPLIYLIIAYRYNKKADQQDKKPINFVTAPRYETAKTISDLEQLTKQKKRSAPPSPAPKPKKPSVEQASVPHTPAPARQQNNTSAPPSVYTTEQKRERLAAHVLANGQIVACDKLTMSDKSVYYLTGVYCGKYGLSDDMPIINDMCIKAWATQHPFAIDLIPFHKNDRLIFVFRHLFNFIQIFNADLEIISEITTPINNTRRTLIPIDYDHLNSHPTVSIIEICDQDINLHTLDLNTNSLKDSTSLYTHPEDNIVAANFNAKNNRLYFINSDDVLMHIGIHDNPITSIPLKPSVNLQNVKHFTVTDDGKFIACAANDGTITLLDQNAQQLGTAMIKDANIFDIQFVDNDQDLLITTNKKSVRMNNFVECFAKQPTYAP